MYLTKFLLQQKRTTAASYRLVGRHLGLRFQWGKLKKSGKVGNIPSISPSPKPCAYRSAPQADVCVYEHPLLLGRWGST